jgi:hypothetical protein
MQPEGSLPSAQNPALVPILRQINPVNTTPSYFSKAGYRLRVAAARSFLCAANSFVCWSTLRKKHRNATRPSQLKEHSTLKSLSRGTKNRSDLVRHAPGSRGSVRSASRGNMVSTLRGKATNTASRGSRAQSIHGLRPILYIILPPPSRTS